MTTLRAAFAPLTRALVLTAVVGALVVGTAFAGKPGGSGTTSSFRVEDGRFASTTTAYRGAGTWVRARCYQNGTLVYEQYVKYGTTGTATLTLGPTSMWQGGAATCVGEDGNWQHGTRWRVTATDAFSASA